MTKHKCSHPLVMFGETMFFKVAALKTSQNKSNSDWQTGVFVGVEASSTEFLFVNKNGLFKCRTARRLVREKVFSQRTLEEAVITIDEYVNKGASTTPPTVTFAEAAVQGVPIESGRTFIPRRARLKPEDFDSHGFTDGCRGCIWMRQNWSKGQSFR